MASVDPPLPSLDRASVSRPAALLAGPLAASCDLSEYRLAGGTALAWALGHRESDDLDFFTRSPGFLNQAEQDRIAACLRALDPDAQVDITQPRTINAVVRNCKVSFFELPGRWLSEPIGLADGISLATVDEIAAMKLVAVSTRSAKKDFIDLHALSIRGYSIERMFSALGKMYPGEIDLDVGYHIARALTDFSDAELDPDPIILDSVNWKQAKHSAARLAADLEQHLAEVRKAR